MKKVLFSALILGLVFTTSCNKDDDGGGDDGCQTCDGYTIEGIDFPEQRVCEDDNGNAVVDGQDTGTDYDQYIEALETFTNCN